MPDQQNGHSLSLSSEQTWLRHCYMLHFGKKSDQPWEEQGQGLAG